jgi:hypothetical protein
MTLALNHHEDCQALTDWKADCSCGVGIETMALSVSSIAVHPISITSLLVELNLASSKSSGSQLISQRAVEIIDDGGRRDSGYKEYLPSEFMIRCGRKWRKVSLI